MMPAATEGDRLVRYGTADVPVDRAAERHAFPVLDNATDAPSTDLGLAAAALANGPVTSGGHSVAPGTRQALVTTKAKARLPEPATWLMLIGGMYGIGAALRRRHRAAEAAFTAKLRSIAAGEDAPDGQ